MSDSDGSMSGMTDEHAMLTLDEAMFLLNDACGQRVVVWIETSTGMLSSSPGTLHPWTSGHDGYVDPHLPPDEFLGFYSIKHGGVDVSTNGVSTSSVGTINVHHAVSAYWVDDDADDVDFPRLAFDVDGDTTLIVEFCEQAKP